MRRWQSIRRDEIQEVLDNGWASTEKEAREGIYIQTHEAAHRFPWHTASHGTQENMNLADQACAHIAETIQERLAQRLPTVATRDTRHPPNVTPRTRTLAILGLHENAASKNACPSIGDGWMASDFYFWMHLLHGMGRSQEWLTSLEPQYLINKYRGEDEVKQELVDMEPDVWKPVQMKWVSGFVQGDPWEERTLVLDKDTLPFAENKVTIGPDGAAPLNSFLQRLEYTFAEAVKSRNPVFILIFAHGDFETPGGLYIDTTSGSSQEILSPEMVAEVLPAVSTTATQTSFLMNFLGHSWIWKYNKRHPEPSKHGI